MKGVEVHHVIEAWWDVVGTMGDADGCRFWMCVKPSGDVLEKAFGVGRIHIEARLIEEQQIRLGGEGFFHKLFRPFAKVSLHFRTDGADARANFVELVARAARLVEDGDIVCIAEGAVACDEGEEGRFAAAVLAFEDPMFTAADCPIEVFEKRAAAEADVDVFEIDDDGGDRGRFFAASLLFGLDGGGRFFVLTAK